MRTVRKITLTLAALLGLSQLLRFDHTNPPVESDVPASPAVKTLLRRACYDCHSRETVWPWYSNVAPVSWWVMRDVSQGRDHLDFSRWGTYDEKTLQKKLSDTVDALNGRGMPPGYYTLLNPHAALSEADRVVLVEWARTTMAQK